jgi:hypothetical protein
MTEIRRNGDGQVLGPRTERRSYDEQLLAQPSLIDGVSVAGRRAFDYYATPAWMTLALLRRVPLFDVLEPCSGEDAIANVLRANDLAVTTNDADPARPAATHLDATQRETWEQLSPRPYRHGCPFWAVTNPPFSLADALVPLAVEHSIKVAMLLRLSWLEPTAARQRFLSMHPPSRLIVLPRHDFRGAGATDSVTSAWFVWDDSGRRGVEVVTKDERDELIALGRP